MILEQCKGVHCVDLGESFPTSIVLAKIGVDDDDDDDDKSLPVIVSIWPCTY